MNGRIRRTSLTDLLWNTNRWSMHLAGNPNNVELQPMKSRPWIGTKLHSQLDLQNETWCSHERVCSSLQSMRHFSLTLNLIEWAELINIAEPYCKWERLISSQQNQFQFTTVKSSILIHIFFGLWFSFYLHIHPLEMASKSVRKQWVIHNSFHLRHNWRNL
jgi:hypothetical protein